MRRKTIILEYKQYQLVVDETLWSSEEYVIITPKGKKTACLSFNDDKHAISIFKDAVDKGKVFDLPLEY